ncbi:hypothetical protein SCH4B_1960 [Ruegeria sp. TrichCH4B]|nr:hypothetical protein SCH4B_1960 [Ruegeria sp. TrichCH4B]
MNPDGPVLAPDIIVSPVFGKLGADTASVPLRCQSAFSLRSDQYFR